MECHYAPGLNWNCFAGSWIQFKPRVEERGGRLVHARCGQAQCGLQKNHHPQTLIHKGLQEGAGNRARTDDLLITNQLLYQLSYAGFYFRERFHHFPGGDNHERQRPDLRRQTGALGGGRYFLAHRLTCGTPKSRVSSVSSVSVTGARRSMEERW